MTTRNATPPRYFVFTPARPQRRPLSPLAVFLLEGLITFLMVFCIGLMAICFT